MVKKTKGSVKRFGARYGSTVKHKLAKIERGLRRFQKCPYCSAAKAKRVALGIWQCRKCGSKFTGKAYEIGQKPRVKEITTTEEVGVAENG